MTVHCRCTYTHSKTGYVISEAFAKLEGQTSITLWGWQGKESSTVIITHTKSDERCACLSIGNDSVNPTSMHDSPSLSLSLHTGVEKNRQIEINSFFINNSQCQVAALIAIHWVSKRNAYLCPVTVITVRFILPPGVLLNVEAPQSNSYLSMKRILHLKCSECVLFGNMKTSSWKRIFFQGCFYVCQSTTT